MRKFACEPVADVAVIRSLVVLALLFGLPLPLGADVAIYALVEAVAALFTRSQVSPVSSSGEAAPADPETVGMDAP
jgi:hypothetical protein